MSSSSHKPRVVQVLYSGLGGHASVVFTIIGADNSKVWNSFLIFIGIEAVLPAYQKKADDLGVPFVGIQTKQGQPWLSWGSLYGALRRFSPDVIILHSISSLIPVLFYSLIHGVRIIAVEHTPFDLRSLTERAMSAIASMYLKWVVVLTDAYKKAYLAQSLPFQLKRKIVVIPNGVNVNKFSMGAKKCTGDRWRIGMAARFTSKKRQDLLILALVQLVQSYPEVSWEISLAGDGNTIESLRRLASVCGVADRVEFVGNLAEAELINWFRTLDLYAHASEGETLSTSMLQAMAMGLPIVASKVPGIDSLLGDGVGKLGILVSKNTSEAFANEIFLLYSAPDVRERLGELSRAEIIHKYSQDAMFQAYNNIVRESLN